MDVDHLAANFIAFPLVVESFSMKNNVLHHRRIQVGFKVLFLRLGHGEGLREEVSVTLSLDWWSLSWRTEQSSPQSLC